ncbi:polysaccharide biosynthesis C-terminal domain-containing protein [Citreicella sp. C3M06]|uniref:MATE family efflux transporter n=1 Tax=Citreicella sp. C3M06 TaxID=2841564 RepID=UPI001C087E97|nr:polysaccharide biosynthesis C-terminal domain-containing protein [Citreicella sp. C3M06]
MTAVGAGGMSALRSPGGLFALAWPMAMRMLMLHGIVVVDAWLVAPLGEASVAAIGLASAVAALLLGAQNAFANAAQILVAQAWGSASPSALRSACRTGLVINLAVCAVGLSVLALATDPLLSLSGQSAEVQAQARLYLLIFIGVVLAEAVGQSLSAFFNGCGDSRAPFLSYIVSVPINVGLSWALIHGAGGLPQLGLAGAAVGSVLGSLVRAGYLVWRVWRSTDSWRRADSLPLRPALRAHLAFSLPIAATFFSAQASGSVCMLIYAAYDVYQFAALTLVMPWINVVGTLGMAWAQAAGIAVAQHLGQGGGRAAMDHFLRMVWRGSAGLSVLVSGFYALLILEADSLYAALAPQTLTALATFLPVLLILPWPKNSNAICGNTLRAAGRTVYVMHIFLWSQWAFKVPLSAVLVLWLDTPVVWVLALNLAEEFVKFIPFHRGMLKGRWRDALPD